MNEVERTVFRWLMAGCLLIDAALIVWLVALGWRARRRGETLPFPQHGNLLLQSIAGVLFISGSLIGGYGMLLTVPAVFLLGFSLGRGWEPLKQQLRDTGLLRG